MNRIVVVNSRQRRKLEAEKHNALVVENEAYLEDKVRDPAKYERNISSRSRRSTALMCALIGATISYTHTEL
jgi:hypothetical protein